MLYSKYQKYKRGLNMNINTNENNIQNNLNTNTDLTISNEQQKYNCLALTIKKNYNLTIIKNFFFTSNRISLKIFFSSFILNILKLFF